MRVCDKLENAAEKGEIGKKKDTKQKVYTGGTTVKEEGRNRRIEK